VFADTFTRNCEPGQKGYFHEAQVSVLLVGIDEWVWTLYCLVETHFEEVQDPSNLNKYVTQMVDAPSGQFALYDSPIWNPREYFFAGSVSTDGPSYSGVEKFGRNARPKTESPGGL
jgi:hypothetical protein